MLHWLARVAPTVGLGVATVLILATQGAAPRAGEPVAVLFPPWVGRAGVLRAFSATPDAWRLVALRAAWPFTVLVAANATAGIEDQGAFRRATGGWLLLSAASGFGCLAQAVPER